MSRPPASTPAIGEDGRDGEDDREDRRDDCAGGHGARTLAVLEGLELRARLGVPLLVAPGHPLLEALGMGLIAVGLLGRDRLRLDREGRVLRGAPLALLPLGSLPIAGAAHWPDSRRAAGSTASKRAAVAARGSSASRMARTTQMRSAPAATTSPTLAGVDAADGEPGNRGDLGRRPNQLETGGRPPLLGGRLPDRPDADVVDGLAPGGLDLLARVGGEPDDRVRAHDPARLGGVHVVLADVDSVGAELQAR